MRYQEMAAPAVGIRMLLLEETDGFPAQMDENRGAGVDPLVQLGKSRRAAIGMGNFVVDRCYDRTALVLPPGENGGNLAKPILVRLSPMGKRFGPLYVDDVESRLWRIEPERAVLHAFNAGMAVQ